MGLHSILKKLKQKEHEVRLLMLYPFMVILDLNSLKTHHWYILPCSAVTGDNLITGIDWLRKYCSSRATCHRNSLEETLSSASSSHRWLT
ncbi:ADP-ribosylation factor-like protein 2 [Portunus trituberculatus]|uniref:ADP-ribosylation factor-like protein 2 n=1 Tax=Portunus trituberculatus TaxID=210409 RepID=A0A5B7DKQ6_PORTR|nr:ADP-ribosylation factor-like protein 2 [Portunus trituberculatus]